MTPEVARYLEKARKCLLDARSSLGFGLSNDAGRGVLISRLSTLHRRLSSSAQEKPLKLTKESKASFIGLP
jgi:hypothetical protein